MGRRLRTSIEISRKRRSQSVSDGSGDGQTIGIKTNPEQGGVKRCVLTTYLFNILISLFILLHLHQGNGNLNSVIREHNRNEHLSHQPPPIPARRMLSEETAPQNWKKKWWRGKVWWRGQGRGRGQNLKHPHLGARAYATEEVGVVAADNETTTTGGGGGDRLQRLYRYREHLNMIVDPSPKRLYSSYDWADPERRLFQTGRGSIPIEKICPTHIIGPEGAMGYHILHKVGNGLIKLGDKERESPPRRRSKILCMVYSSYENEGYNPAVAAIAETWAPRCDGFWAATNYTNHTIGAIDLPFPKPKNSGEDNTFLWQKVRAMWAYAHDNYLDEYDFFHITRDNSYLVVDNLRAFLDGPHVERLENGYLDEISNHPNHRASARKWTENLPRNRSRTTPGGEAERPLVFGLPAPHGDKVVPARGTGYTLNRAALRLLGREGVDTWYPDLADAREGALVGSFFASRGVHLSHVFDGEHKAWLFGEGADLMTRTLVALRSHQYHNPKHFWLTYGLRAKTGMDSVPETFAAFHLSLEVCRIEKAAVDLNGKPFTPQKKREVMAELIHRYHAELNFLC